VVRVATLPPRQLPLAARGFVGRTEHLAELDALLPEADGSGGDAVVISALDGTAGVGKMGSPATSSRWRDTSTTIGTTGIPA
jgi:hypothetical protein